MGSVEEADLGYGDRKGRVLTQLRLLAAGCKYGTGLRSYERFYPFLLSFILRVKAGIVRLVSKLLVVWVGFLLKLLEGLQHNKVSHSGVGLL